MSLSHAHFVHHPVRMRRYDEKKVAKIIISDMMKTQIPALRMCSPSNGAEVAICSPYPLNGKSSFHQFPTPMIMTSKPATPISISLITASVPVSNSVIVFEKPGNPIMNNMIPKVKIIGEAEP